MVTPKKIKPDVQNLGFDPENPRFLDMIGSADGEARAIKRMIEEENLEELVGSIGNQGFFAGEPLLVVPNQDEPGKFVVIEGNRRLAALKVLNGLVSNEILTPSLRILVDQASKKPSEVDCFEFPLRKDILKYLGFRHISGPRRWEPLSKARYLADLIKNFYSDLDQSEQLKAVAKDIGSKKDYVAQLLTTLSIYDRAKNKDFYNLQRVREEDINFSLLSTALSYRNIVSFLNLPSREVVVVDGIDDAHAKEIFSWMFAQNERGETVLGESRNLKILAAVLDSPAATDELRKESDLNHAYQFSAGPAEAFNSMLATVEINLEHCLKMLRSGIGINEAHVNLAEKISDNAGDLYLLLQKDLRRSKSRLSSLEGDKD